jgi:hypothetical protein
MKTHLFIVTYDGDLDWSPTCVKSIAKFLKGDVRKVAIIPPEHERTLQVFRDSGIFEVIPTPQWKPGYLYHMATKCRADELIGAAPEDLIIFMDTDMSLVREVGAEAWMRDGLPSLVVEKYCDPVTGQSIGSHWEEATRKALGLKRNDLRGRFECMRTPWRAFWASSVRDCRARISKVHRRPFEDYVKSCWETSEDYLLPHRKFGSPEGWPTFADITSIGLFCMIYEPARYSITELTPGHRQIVEGPKWLHCGWSHALPKESDLACWRAAGLC